MKGHLFTADRVLRSVSRVIYRPATPEGLYMGREGAEGKALSGRILRALQLCVPVVDARIVSHTHTSSCTHTPSVQPATPQLSHCYV